MEINVCSYCNRIIGYDRNKYLLHLMGDEVNIPICLCEDCYKKASSFQITMEYKNGEYPVLEIAKYIIHSARAKDKTVNNLKLSFILYFLWIEYYNHNQKYLFDDFFTYQVLGPQVDKVYWHYCGSGAMNIYPYEECPNYTTMFDIKDLDLFDEVIDEYIDISPMKLSHMAKNLDVDYIALRDKRIPFEKIIEEACAIE